jgi:hypothetical protein
MVQILSPKSITRGQDFKGLLEVKVEELKGARALEIMFYNSITFGREKKNYSAWKFKKRVSAEEAREKKEIPFEFPVEAFAPITYSGKSINSKWRIKVKVDMPNALDREIEQEVTVFR